MKNKMAPIGFRAIRDRQLPVSIPIENTQNIDVLERNRFADAVIKSIGEFIDEEFSGRVYAAERLVEKIKAARLLFDDDKKQLSSIYNKNSLG